MLWVSHELVRVSGFFLKGFLIATVRLLFPHLLVSELWDSAPEICPLQAGMKAEFEWKAEMLENILV